VKFNDNLHPQKFETNEFSAFNFTTLANVLIVFGSLVLGTTVTFLGEILIINLTVVSIKYTVHQCMRCITTFLAKVKATAINIKL